MRIQVLTRAAAQLLSPDEKCAIISITNTPDDIIKFEYNNNIKGVLRLHFYDEDHISILQYNDATKLKLFETADALKVLTFFESVKDKIDVLYIHCQAGISRSPAIAAALCDLYGIESSANWFFNYSPNFFVYRKMMDSWELFIETKGEIKEDDGI